MIDAVRCGLGCPICGGPSPIEHAYGCCSKCGTQHDPELPCGTGKRVDIRERWPMGKGETMTKEAREAARQAPTLPPPAQTVQPPGCALCSKKLAYPGARFCGAACCARWEAGERPAAPTSPVMTLDRLAELASIKCWEELDPYLPALVEVARRAEVLRPYVERLPPIVPGVTRMHEMPGAAVLSAGRGDDEATVTSTQLRAIVEALDALEKRVGK